MPGRESQYRPVHRPFSFKQRGWTTRATRNLTAPLERLRVDRQLEGALTHGADPLHLALGFGIDEKTVIRYADSARALLGEPGEQAPQ